MDDIESIDRAIAGLEAQRGVLGDDVAETALGPLREKRSAILARVSDEQRRLVTVLFSDLVDFTVLSQTLDAEDVRAVINAYFKRCQDSIEAAGGVVEKFIGDAVMAVFGLYQAREDDPHRAIRAGLAMMSSLEQLNVELEATHGVQLAMRVGIDTGDVVVGGLGDRPGQDFVVVGETVNRAARLQAAAPPGGILISGDTFRHVRGSFGVDPRPGLQLKGISQPVDAYLVVGERPEGFSLDAARGIEGVETATVGRDGELHVLQDRFWDVVEERRFRVLTILGDAGVGKSRLLVEFDRWLAELPDAVWWFHGRASPTLQETPNALLRDVLSGRFSIRESDPPETVREKWERGFETAFGEGEETRSRARTVAHWLGYEIGAEANESQDPQAFRERAQRALVDYLRRLVESAPVAVLIEDLHWADESSLEIIDALHAAIHDCPVLIVGTTRPPLLERHPHWGEGLDYHVRLHLDPLSQRESRRLLAEIMRRADDVPPAVVELVVGTAEGNPYFIEELVTFLLEAGVITVDDGVWHVHEDLLERVHVPPTLRGVLQARVDALPPSERHVLQRASVVGRVFWDQAVDGLTASGAPEDDPPVEVSLDGLRSREVVFERDRSAFDQTREFLFKHALLRDVTYDTVLRTRRQRYHALAARWLEDMTAASGRAEEYAAAIAEHHARAGDGDVAALWYLRAGGRAMVVHALAEAEWLLGRGIDVVSEANERSRFDLLLARETVRHRMGDRVGQAEDLAALEALAGSIDDPTRRGELLLARARWHFHGSEYVTQADIAQQAVSLARDAGLEDLEAEALLSWGQALTWKGSHDEANQVLGEALAAARLAGSRRVEGDTLRYLSIVANNRSDFTRSLELLDEAVAVHRAIQDDEGESVVIGQKASVLYNLERLDEARACLEEVIPRYEASGYRYRQAIAMSNLGSIVSLQGELDAAKRLLTDGLEVVRSIDDREGTATALNVLGDIRRRVGDVAEAEALLTESLDLARALGFSYLACDCALNLALILVDRGDIATALEWVQEAGRLAAETDSGLQAARASFAEGRVLLAAGRLDEAETALATAADVAHRVGLDTLGVEVQAARAQVAWQVGRAVDAVALAAELAGTEPAALQGAMDGGAVYLAAYEVLHAAGDARAAGAAETGARFVDEYASRIHDDAMREAFRHEVRSNSALLSLRSSEGS